MRKNKVFATAAIAALAAAQMAMPAMAATTNNGKENLGDKNNAALTENLKNDGHTLFSVFETNKDVGGQVSFTVPLYVTMAAKDKATSMIVPDGYYIENNGEKPIGITGMEVETFAKWKITKDTAPTKYDMTFSLNEKGKDEATSFKFPEQAQNTKVTLFDRTNWKNAGGTDGAGKDNILQGVENFFFSAQNDYQKPGFKKIEGKMDLQMASTIKQDTRVDSKTVPAFKVTYTLSELDNDGQPKTSTYVGDDKGQATAEVVGVK